MEFTRIGGTDIEVSRIALGTWSMGGFLWGGADERSALGTIRSAMERGITLIDTAPVYGLGLSEELIGKALAESGGRERVVLATKAGLEWRGNAVFRNSTRARVLKEIDDSLRRLRTDYIDVYQVHWPDPLVPIEETAEAMHVLYQRKKIRAIGVSNYTPKQIDAFRRVAPLHTVQPRYNLFERDVEEDILPYCREHALTLLAYSPLCRSLLSGRVTTESRFAGDDLRTIDRKFLAPALAKHLQIVDALDRFAQTGYGKRVVHLALRWVMDQPGVGVVLCGARRPEQLESAEAAVGWTLDRRAQEQIEAIIRGILPSPVDSQLPSPASRQATETQQRV